MVLTDFSWRRNRNYVPMRRLAILAVMLLPGSPVAAHHSDAGLDMDSVVTFEGTVSEFNWRNPHVYFTVETTDGQSESVEWLLQMGSTMVLTRRGWSRDSLTTGDSVRVSVHAALDGRTYGLLESIENEGGVEIPTGPDTLVATAKASSVAGTWFADTSKLVSYPGGFDGFFDAQLALTEKARAAVAAYDPLSTENPEATCAGRPTPAMIVSTGLYPLQIQINDDEDTIVIRSEFWDQERTVFMDGREDPVASARFDAGYSIGRWDGDTLVVDTRNFADHRSPYQIGVPSGSQKHVVERYRLVENGTRLLVEFMLEDPEYLAEPMSHSRELIYSPHLTLSRFDCDLEATKRFLRE
jgi:hypothetical protein